MKELLTKKFWQDVKKTFDDAQQDVAPKQEELPQPSEDPPVDASAGDVPSPS